MHHAWYMIVRVAKISTCFSVRAKVSKFFSVWWTDWLDNYWTGQLQLLNNGLVLYCPSLHPVSWYFCPLNVVISPKPENLKMHPPLSPCIVSRSWNYANVFYRFPKFQILFRCIICIAYISWLVGPSVRITYSPFPLSLHVLILSPFPHPLPISSQSDLQISTCCATLPVYHFLCLK